MADALATDLLCRPGLELAGLVRGGEVSSRELVETSLARIDELNPRVNAFVHVDAEGALAAADAIGPGDERPFAGVPIAVKTEFPVEGLPLTMGSDLFGDFVAPHDAHLVRRLREAGCVIVGMANMPEMGVMPVTEPRRHGPTRNPWDRDRTPGGSSGGSAAAVAAGMVPLAHGADGGGSIRIPAACCGLVGLKATRHRISRAPDLVEPLTWTIYESARGLSSLDYLSAVLQLQAFSRGLIASLSPYDALLTPSLAKLPVPIGTYDTGRRDLEEWARTGEFTPFAAMANITGLPAISLPFAQSEEGLPLGIHLLGQPAREDVLLALGAQLERERDWGARRAPLAES